MNVNPAMTTIEEAVYLVNKNNEQVSLRNEWEAVLHGVKIN